MSSLSPFLRVTSSLIIRELSTRFGGRPGGYIWVLIEPAGYIAMMSIIFGAIARTPALGTSFILFFATGYMSFSFYKQTENYVSSAISANKTLLQYPTVAPIDAIAARFTLQLHTNLFVAVAIIGLICAFASGREMSLDWGKLSVAFFLASFFGLGEGMMNAALNAKYKLYDKIHSMLTRPMLILSGVFFLPDRMPPPLKEILLYNPICHAIMLFRQGFYPEYRADGLSIDYLAGFAATMFALGMSVFTFYGRAFKER